MNVDVAIFLQWPVGVRMSKVHVIHIILYFVKSKIELILCKIFKGGGTGHVQLRYPDHCVEKLIIEWQLIVLCYCMVIKISHNIIFL